MDALASRSSSHYTASSSRQQAVSRHHRPARVCHATLPRGRRRMVTQALFDPPPFQPEKLDIRYTPCASLGDSIPASRRYTLTHNDITAALRLTVGSDYNYEQISGFYTRLLRDEVIAEWKFEPNPTLHIYCHVSGEERWLAPPLLRNYIFRREMPLVLETLLYAERELLALQPHLSQAPVYIHFESSEQELDTVELWGTLGERTTWQPIPTSVLKRLILALAGIKVQPQSPTQPERSALDKARETPATFTTGRPLPVVAALDVQAAGSLESSDSTGQEAGQTESDSAVQDSMHHQGGAVARGSMSTGSSTSRNVLGDRMDVMAITCSPAAAAASAQAMPQAGMMASTAELLFARLPQAARQVSRTPAKRH